MFPIEVTDILFFVNECFVKSLDEFNYSKLFFHMFKYSKCLNIQSFKYFVQHKYKIEIEKINFKKTSSKENGIGLHSLLRITLLKYYCSNSDLL